MKGDIARADPIISPHNKKREKAPKRQDTKSIQTFRQFARIS